MGAYSRQSPDIKGLWKPISFPEIRPAPGYFFPLFLVAWRGGGVNVENRHVGTEVKKGGLAVMAGGEVKADGKFSGGNEAAGFGGDDGDGMPCLGDGWSNRRVWGSTSALNT